MFQAHNWALSTLGCQALQVRRPAALAAVSDAATREGGKHGSWPGLEQGGEREAGGCRLRAAAAQQADKIDWAKVGAACTVIGGIAVIHGMRHHRWLYIHTIGVVLGIAAAIAPPLIKLAGAKRAPETG